MAEGTAITERQQAEGEFWDSVAARRGDRPSYAYEGTWEKVHDLILQGVGDVRDKRVLDCGCGEGELTQVLADRGATAVGFDLSFGQVTDASGAGQPTGFVQAPFEHLPFRDQAFDAIVGKFVLHHVELGQAAVELQRLLPVGGEAMFLETWMRNPLLRAARGLRGRGGVVAWGSDDESPLVPADLAPLTAHGFEVTMSYPGFVFLQLLDNNVLKRRWPGLSKVIERVDTAIGGIKAVKPYGYYAFIHLRRTR